MPATKTKVYRQREKQYQERLAKGEREALRLSWLRVFLFLWGTLFLIWAGHGGVWTGYFLSVLSFTAFFISVHGHNRQKAENMRLFVLRALNCEARNRLSGAWTNFSDQGDEFVDIEHPYTHDLQVFGPSSLFQFINTTFSWNGRRRLATMFTDRTDTAEIRHRQQAVAELAGRLDFCQEYEARGRLAQLRDKDPSTAFTHLEQAPSPAARIMLKALWLFPALPLMTLAGVIAGLLPLVSFTLPFTIQIMLALWGAVAVAPLFGGAEKAARSLRHYVALLHHLEDEEFQAPHLIELRNLLFTGGKAASRQLGALSRITDLISLRYSQPFIYHPINVLLLWDWHTLARLQGWKERCQSRLPAYLEVLAEVEALSSLAVLARDNPGWAFPQINQGEPHLRGEELGHPLLQADLRVTNSLQLPHQARVCLITGSNMSGKSTWLRTVGLNLVLAYAGAPVCAHQFRASLMNIYCKMQVQDDLQEGISHFWAELKRIKDIIDAAHTGGPLIFLLDEIFRGTNSRDRILATRIVMEKLISPHTLGLITTHDLELADSEEEHAGTVVNYHFSDRVDDEGIHFDHRLRRGVSPSSNALALMNIIGITAEDPPGP